MRDSSPTPKPPPADIILPLLCGVLAMLCLLVVPYRPIALRPVGALAAVLGLVLGGVSWLQGVSQRTKGCIEIGTVPFEGNMEPAFLIPYAHRLVICHLVLAVVIAGCAGNLLLVELVGPSSIRGPWLAFGGFGLFYAVLLAAYTLPFLIRRSAYLALLPEGIVSTLLGNQCVVPWDQIEQVAAVRLKIRGIAGPLTVGFRFFEPDKVVTPTRSRRRIYGIRAVGWDFVLMDRHLGLSARKLTYLIAAYQQHPGERAKIGTERELAEVREALAQLKVR
jgi:hypothetical protein